MVHAGRSSAGYSPRDRPSAGEGINPQPLTDGRPASWPKLGEQPLTTGRLVPSQKAWTMPNLLRLTPPIVASPSDGVTNGWRNALRVPRKV